MPRQSIDNLSSFCEGINGMNIGFETDIDAWPMRYGAFSLELATGYTDNSASIGRTPLVRLGRLTAGLRAKVYAKIEGRNPAYSVKDRIGAAMIWDAEARAVIPASTYTPARPSANPSLSTTAQAWSSVRRQPSAPG
jgi:hypothetical protein